MTAPRDTVSEPRTEAGRRMHKWLGWHPVDGRDDYILAIEAEAARVADDRLARVVEAVEKLWDQSVERMNYKAGPVRSRAEANGANQMAAAVLALLAPAPDRPAEPVLDVDFDQAAHDYGAIASELFDRKYPGWAESPAFAAALRSAFARRLATEAPDGR